MTDERIKRAASVPPDWDGRGAVPPNQTSVELANAALKHFKAAPHRIDPSTDAGICLSVRSGDRYADIEVFNDGSILTATCVNGGSPSIRGWSRHTMREAVREVESFVEAAR